MGAGMLAMTYSIDSEHETDYLHWLTREHTLERVSLPGFQRARLFRKLDTTPGEFLTLYDLNAVDVLTSAEYLERLNHPTPWSQRNMPRMQNMTRGGGSIIQAAVGGEGAFVAVLRLEREVVRGLADASGRHLVERIAGLEQITSVRVLEVDSAATGVQTSEKAIRGEDMSFDGLLIVEGVDAAAVRAAAGQAAQALTGENGSPAPVPDVFSALFSRRKPG